MYSFSLQNSLSCVPFQKGCSLRKDCWWCFHAIQTVNIHIISTQKREEGEIYVFCVDLLGADYCIRLCTKVCVIGENKNLCQ